LDPTAQSASYPFAWRFLKETLGFFDFAAAVLGQIQNT
jgi:hypothetical protein